MNWKEKDFVYSIGNLEWLDKTKRRCLILWKSPEEWSKTVYQWVQESIHLLIDCIFSIDSFSRLRHEE